MAEPSPRPFNPCLLDENEQIPAKIWELLRRNRDFRDVVRRLSILDFKERNDCEKSGKYHGAAWGKSWRLVERVNAQHPFAGVALQWLVPEPLFHCRVAAWPRGKKWKQRGVFITRFLRVGEGVKPNVKDMGWVWRNLEKPDIAGHPIRRGPEVYWTKSRFKRLRSWVNPILEWRRYPWPFTVEHSWTDAPAQFRREFHFIWRRQFDCRPTNPLTQDRRDSPSPHETTFFHDWNLMSFRASGHLAQDDLYQVIRFKELADDFRVFAIPKTILTKASADAMGQWLSDELKKGSDLYGDLLKGKLLNECEMFGTTSEWTDWLPHHAGLPAKVAKDTHFYRRCRYMTTLVDLIFPRFEISKLLAPPPHRARGKKYVRK
jgi:hypothetical protein